MTDWLRWIAYVVLLASLIPVALTIREFLRSRRAKYYAVRQSALRRAARFALVSLLLVALGAALFGAPSLLPQIIQTPTPTPTATAQPSPSPSPSPRPSPTPTPTRRPTATAPLIPTATPEVLLPESALSPLPSAVPAGEDAEIELLALATGEDEEGRPLEPGSEFPPGDHRMYLFFQYEGMEDGVMTTFAWYREGEFIEGCSDTWLWGMVEDRHWGESGKISYFCEPAGGWEPGQYEIHVFIEDRLQGIAQFVITEETEEQ